MFVQPAFYSVVVPVLLSLLSTAVLADDIPRSARVSAPPAIDGQFEDGCWKQTDVLTGFTKPASLEHVKDQTEVRVVFDAHKIYIAAKAFESEPAKMRKLGSNPFECDCLEFFIRPDVNADTYYQIAVGCNGSVYTGQVHTEWTPPIELRTRIDKDCWTTELAIPLSAMGIKAADDSADRTIAFNVTRTDSAEPMRTYSSFSPLQIADFHAKQWWSKLTLAGSVAKPKSVSLVKAKKNFIANPEFAEDANEDGIPDGWFVSPEYAKSRAVYRNETAPLSKDWLVVATPKSYAFIRQKIKLKTGQVYTAKIVARSRSGKASFGFSQCLPGGATTHAVWACPVTDSFRPYFATFTASETTWALGMYRMGEGDLEVSSVHLYEGKLSPLSIRRYSPSGDFAEVPGTARPIPKNIYGGKSANGRMKLLFVSYRLYTSREILEVVSGLDADVDILLTSGWNVDTYYTENDPDTIRRHLDDGEYDAYILGRLASRRIGKEFAGILKRNINAGASLVVVGTTDKWLNNKKPTVVGTDHYLANGLPSAMLPEGRPVKQVTEDTLGKGKLIGLELNHPGWDVQICAGTEEMFRSTFPMLQFTTAYWARVLQWASNKVDARIAGFNAAGGVATVSLANVSNPAKLRVSIVDKHGRDIWKDELDADGAACRFDLPKLKLDGPHAVCLWLEDSRGQVFDYLADTIDNKADARIVTLLADKEAYVGDGPATFKLTTEGTPATLAWELHDVFGRVLVADTKTNLAAGVTTLEVPIDAVRTNLTYLWVSLLEGETAIDKFRLPVLVADRDRARILNDFGVTVWPDGCTNPQAQPYLLEQLLAIGVTMKNHSHDYATLAAGLGASSMIMGGRQFWNPNKAGSTVRSPCLRDPKVVDDIKAAARKRAERDRKFGPVCTQIVDEPSLCGPWKGNLPENCSSSHCLAEYRNRLEAKYKTLDELNARFGTTYGAWDDIKLIATAEVRKRNNYTEFIEFWNYRVDTWVETLKTCTDEYHRLHPGSPVSLQNSFGHQAISGNDYYKLLTRVGLGYGNEYLHKQDDPIHSMGDYYRSFAPNMRVWGYMGYGFGPEPANFLPWWFAMHRFGGMSFYATTGASPGGVNWNLVTVPRFGLTKRSLLLRDGTKTLREGLGKVFLDYDWAPRDIAVLYSHNNLLLAWCRGTETAKSQLISGSAYYDYQHSRQAVKRMLQDMLYQYDFVAEEQVAQGKLSSFKVLFLPQIEGLSDELIRQIAAFVEAGGTVIADSTVATYDELGAPRKHPAIRAMLKVPMANAETLIKSHGRGRFVFTGKRFDYTDEAMREELLEILGKAGVPPILATAGQSKLSGWEATRFGHDDMRIYGLLSHHRRSGKTQTHMLRFDSRRHLYDMIEGKYLGWTDRVTVELKPSNGVAYGHYPYRIDRLDVSVPPQNFAGADLTVEAAVVTGGGDAGRHVMRMELIRPDGSSPWYFAENVTADAGKVQWQIRMAVNDPVGQWIVRVRDILSGMLTEKTFQLTKE